MKKIKYFIEFLFIKLFFFIFKTIGYKNASNLGAKIGSIFGPLFRSKNLTKKNIRNCLKNINEKEINILIKKMWENYGRIFADYMYIEKFRLNKLKNYIKINGIKTLEKIKKEGKPVVFISGHFSNFELMAMQLEMFGIKLSAVYRPLNNIFLNQTMEDLRRNFICKNQIKKGLGGVREIIKAFAQNSSVALMIDQRVSEGISCNFFNRKALTTTIPAQFVKKFNCKVVPIYIERKNKNQFRLEILNPIKFFKNENIEIITSNLNKVLEKMIKRNPDQWIWTHDRWK